MKNEEILNQEEHDQELPYIKSAFSTIYNGNTKQVSYSDTYNCIYKLCKKGMAEDILNSLSVISTEHFSIILRKIDKNESKMSDFLDMINQVNQSIERIAEILLYIQSNYINDPKRQYNSIKQLLNAAFFDQLCKNKTILQRISEKISEARIKNDQEVAKSVISNINSLDQKQAFFPNFFAPIYFKKISEHYKRIFTQNYHKMETKQYLIQTKKVFKEQREWLQQNFMRNKGKKIIQELMRKIFQTSFDQIKQKVYKQKVDLLFKKYTLQFLELLNEKNEEKQISNFNDWYINQIKKKVTAIDRSNNKKFLETFIYEYLAISDSLADIKNFNIGYKATFFLEHWINQQKIHLPKRLNIYFQDLIIKNSVKKENINNFTILFKFLKEKDYFQKQFRRACALRMIYDKSKSNSQIQNEMVEQMKNQCGDEWIQKLKNLKASLPQCELMSIAHTPKFNAIVFEDISWPFQKIKSAPKIPEELLQLTQNYKQQYHNNFKGRLMEWYPLQGFAILDIKFNQLTQQFKMDTVMATIMLNLQALKFKSSVQSILGRTNLPIQQATEQFQLLEKEGIIKIEGTFKLPEVYQCRVELNFQYKPKKQTNQIDFTQRYLEEEFLQKSGHQELKAERKMMVEAFIVKIMKSNKTLTKSDLYEQITPMIENRGFKFSKQFVDNSFETLIDKRYIRDLEDGCFSYLAS